MYSQFLDRQGNTIPLSQVIGSGATSVVLLQHGIAVKTPLRCLLSSESDVEVNLMSIKREQDVYRRLENPEDPGSSGIVKFIGFLPEATKLAYMANGDLRSYLANHRPSSQLQITWFREMAYTLGYIHERCVLITDIASRNFLLDPNQSIKFCDFSEASLLPLDTDMSTVDDNGYTTQVDIGLLGAVIYEVVTGKKCKIDLYQNNSAADGRAYWPERKSLPSTEDVWLGRIIEGCWNGEFSSAQSLLQALNSDHLLPSSLAQPHPTGWLGFITDSFQVRPITTICGTLGLVFFILYAGSKRSLLQREVRLSLCK
ncbi:hypothetical protein N7466_003938 [Penicillium verhagenii]|uniref:uncharacterized protein n=1 Tax=Penicillium verhagenii TaxID=1562060 RepID=UPI002545B610|nr:uncharacterized protein N7466_003938 [Penicillium verhagenii]KAJ5934391.1 hypothetical protein N7466_003938 [Penicillium verhagenii]